MLLAVMGTHVLAQGAPDVTPSRKPVQFKISAESMDRALKEFAVQSGLQLVFATKEISPLTLARPLSGNYSPEAALRQILAETCLVYRFVNAHTVAIEASRLSCATPRDRKLVRPDPAAESALAGKAP
jgi:iron complex outermembrane receptor protein